MDSISFYNLLVSDQDEEVAELIRLEKEKVENSKRMTETMHTIATELTRIADVMTHIRDVLFNNRVDVS